MKTTYIISTLFLSVLIWACDLMGDVDKVKPYYKLEDQTAIRNAQSAEQVLRGVYTPVSYTHLSHSGCHRFENHPERNYT